MATGGTKRPEGQRGGVPLRGACVRTRWTEGRSGARMGGWPCSLGEKNPSASKSTTGSSGRIKPSRSKVSPLWSPQARRARSMLLVAEKRSRRLKAPHLMKDVYQGAQYVNGVPVNQVTEEKAA